MDKFWAPAPPPKTELGRYRLLSPKAGVHVSPIQLGAMSIGDKWADIGFAPVDRDATFELLDAYFDNGGNFIDTANNYQDGASEEYIGDWMQKRGNRDQIFLATKYTSNFIQRDGSIPQKIFFTGNSAKSMNLSLETSLKRLKTTYIDLFYLHWWDWDTSIEEVMQSLNRLVLSGKVLYLGISDTPAWIVSRANQYARDHGLAQFVVYQGMWNVMDRSFERDIIPMAYAEGMALAPWGVLSGGKIRSDEEEAKRKQTGEGGRTFAGPQWERGEQEKKVAQALAQVAKEVGAKHVTAVAIAYVLHKAPFVFPIIGGRKVEHLLANVEALSISLTPEQIQFLESAVPFDPGFPSTMVGNGERMSAFLTIAAPLSQTPRLQPIRPSAPGSDDRTIRSTVRM